jgi:hypothetical protein
MTNRSYFAARSMVGRTTCSRDGFIDLLRKSATVLRCTFGDVETRTGATRLDSSYDTLMVIAVHAIRRGRAQRRNGNRRAPKGLREPGSGIHGGLVQSKGRCLETV